MGASREARGLEWGFASMFELLLVGVLPPLLLAWLASFVFNFISDLDISSSSGYFVVFAAGSFIIYIMNTIKSNQCPLNSVNFKGIFL